MRDERGFTLPELLVTILIIGILVGIAITQYVGQKDRGSDAEAKSHARNLVTQVESCFASKRDFQQCDTQGELDNTGGVPYGTAPGQVSVTGATATSYEVEAVSKSTRGGTRHLFKVEKDVATGVVDKNCKPAGSGGCPGNGHW